MENNTLNTWSVWIDEVNKVISTKKISTAKEIQFKDQESGMDVIIKLISKGFKIG